MPDIGRKLICVSRQKNTMRKLHMGIDFGVWNTACWSIWSARPHMKPFQNVGSFINERIVFPRAQRPWSRLLPRTDRAAATAIAAEPISGLLRAAGYSTGA